MPATHISTYGWLVVSLALKLTQPYVTNISTASFIAYPFQYFSQNKVTKVKYKTDLAMMDDKKFCKRIVPDGTQGVSDQINNFDYENPTMLH